ncbi:MAG: single-stranded DNA-binding protein [Firmicutes bacterium]|nr:single-stranded DNA-binding protein [Bacillota bacterium]
MTNQCILIGRLVSDPEIRETENEKKLTTITIAVQRSYKNVDGEYDVDFIDIVLWNDLASNTCEYSRKGDMVGIKGRIQVSNYEAEDGTKRKVTEVIAERVTFLSSRKED